MIYKILLFVCVGTNVMAQFLLKSGMKQVGLVVINRGVFMQIKEMITNINFLGGIFFYGISFFLYSVVLSRIELSKAYPVSSVAGIIVITVLSILIFHEQYSVSKITGIVLCLAGIILIFK